MFISSPTISQNTINNHSYFHMDKKYKEVALDTQKCIHTIALGVKFRGRDTNPSFHSAAAASKR